jgi:predicted acylesterase/phospholipase RssA
VPGVFAAVTVGDNIYVDGAVTDPFPRACVGPDHLGLAFDSPVTPHPVTSVGDFVRALGECRLPPVVASRTVVALDAAAVDPLDFAMPLPRLQYWYRHGARQALQFLKKTE